MAPVPVLSVIIPTVDRPSDLARAITSAIASAGGRSVEVVVVPNGPAESWRRVAADLATDARVRFVPIATRHASAARNAGLAAARGGFVRFLDDDDYLYPDAAAAQLADLEASGADLSSGDIDVVTDQGARLWTWRQPPTDDLATAMLGYARATLTHAHLYRASAIRGLRWDETLPVGQDVDWMLRVCASREQRWRTSGRPVGAWVQHRGPRIYRGRHPGAAAALGFARMILRTAEALQAQGRLDGPRRAAAADGLWGAFQKGLMYDPPTWYRIAARARALAPGRHPPSAIYSVPVFRGMDPRVVETALLPVRWLHWLARRVAGRINDARA